MGDERLHQILMFEEGVEHGEYRDSKGIWTIACGWNIKARGLPSYAAVEYFDSLEKTGAGRISDQSVLRMLEPTAATAIVDADDFIRISPHPIAANTRKELKYPDGVTVARRRAIANMMFQMGRDALMHPIDGFVETRKYIHAGDWEGAAKECLDSRWAKVDTPARAKRVSQALRTGNDDFYLDLI